ncbi:hypothetical protein DVH24_030935 [Malus domestica]|uniref:Uncharacterized protein n=1 Tax=Malus domestica TaxID=3750 RepID=A0A498HFE9_MALDO|nr:hypothetical protein DVH24_030935 [Malus domestica]
MSARPPFMERLLPSLEPETYRSWAKALAIAPRYVCVRGFERKTRAPRPLMARLHFPASKMTKTKNEEKK